MTELAEGLRISGSVAALVMGAGWLLSLMKRDVSIVDPMWSMVFVAAAWSMHLFGGGESGSGRSVLMLAMVTVWGVRLAAHLAERKWGSPEDYRYAAMRRRYRPFELWSMPVVFGLQGALVVVVSLPVQAVLTDRNASPLGWLDWLGLAVWGIGFAFETVSDAQLRRFRSDRANCRAVMDRGLWKYSRHPNYFGDCLVWWGIFLLGVSAGASWTVLGPLVMTLLLLRISGVALLERTIVDRRPGYADYVRRTSPFVPRRPRP